MDYLKSLGVDHVVDSGSQNVIQSVKEFLKARKLKGVDVLYDPVGGKLTKESLKLLNWGAHILIIGFASGEVPLIPANIALVKVYFKSRTLSLLSLSFMTAESYFSIKLYELFLHKLLSHRGKKSAKEIK